MEITTQTKTELLTDMLDETLYDIVVSNQKVVLDYDKQNNTEVFMLLLLYGCLTRDMNIRTLDELEQIKGFINFVVNSVMLPEARKMMQGIELYSFKG